MAERHTSARPLIQTVDVPRSCSSGPFFSHSSDFAFYLCAPVAQCPAQPRRNRAATTPTLLLPDCTPESPFLFLFAYSNDFSDRVVLDTVQAFSDEYFQYPFNFTKLANVRFDTIVEEPIEFHDSVGSWVSAIHSKLPDQNLRFPDEATGSNVLTVIKQLLATQTTSICGAAVSIIMKRFSSESDEVSPLFTSLQRHHIEVHTSMSNSSSGGHNTNAMYKISSCSNGIFVYIDDAFIDDYTVYNLDGTSARSLLYAVNPEVVGKGHLELAQVQTIQGTGKSSYDVYALVNVENNGALLNFRALNITLIDPNLTPVAQIQILPFNFHSSFYATHFQMPTYSSYYRVFLDYDYSGSQTNQLQIRFETHEKSSTWPPFYN